MNEIDKQIYDLLDDNYLKKYSDIVTTYYEAIGSNNELKDEAKKKYRDNAKELIHNLVSSKREKAQEIIENERGKGEFKFPDYPEPEDKEDKILNETKRSTALSIIKEEIKATDSPQELIDIARSYENEELLARDVDRLVKANLKRLGEERSIERLEAERKPDQSKINGAESLMKMLTNNRHFAVIEQADDGIKPQFRKPEKDLMEGKAPGNGNYDPKIYKAIKGLE